MRIGNVENMIWCKKHEGPLMGNHQEKKSKKKSKRKASAPAAGQPSAKKRQGLRVYVLMTFDIFIYSVFNVVSSDKRILRL